MSKSPAMDLVMQFMGRQNTIPTPVPLIRLLGDHAAAAFLSQCLYWGDRTEDAGGWFHKTHEEWEEELVLSPDQVRRCVRTCGPLVEVKRKGIPARNYYRANRTAVGAALEAMAAGDKSPISRCGETQQLEADKLGGKARTNPTAVRGETPRQGVQETQHLITEPTQNLQQKENTLTADAAASVLDLEDSDFDELLGLPNGSGADAPDPEPASPVQTKPAAPEGETNKATSKQDVPPAAPHAPAPARLTAPARIIAAWNEHRGTLPEVLGLSEGRKKAIKKLLADCEGDVERAAALVADATREVAADDYWKTHRYGFDNLVPGKVFGRAESWRSRQHTTPPSSTKAAAPEAPRTREEWLS